MPPETEGGLLPTPDPIYLNIATITFVIARKSALVVVTNVLNGLLNYLSLYLIARFYYLPKFALGLLNFTIGFVALYRLIPNAGFPQAHIKRVSEGKDIGKCNATFFFIRLILTFVMIFAVFASLFIWKHVVGRGFEDPVQEKAVYVMLCYNILLMLAQNFITTYRAKKEIAIAQFPFFMEALARTIATAYFVAFDYPLIFIVYTYVIGGAALFFTSILFFREPIDKPSKEYFSTYFQFAIPVSLVSVSFIIMTNLDKVLVQLFWSYEEGADYFSIVRLTRFINSITVAFGLLLLPTMSAMYIRNRLEEMKAISIKAERYMSMILMPVVFLLIFLAPPVTSILLTKKFSTAIPILQVLPLFALFDALERPYQSILLGMDLPKLARNRMLIMLFVNVILNLLLIPRDIRSLGIKLFGLAGTGAAIATVVAYFSGLVYTRIIIYKISKIGVNVSVIKHFIAAIIMGLIMNYLTEFYIVNRWYDLLILFIMGIFIYLGILVAIREFKKEDFDLFIDTINPKKMLLYMKEEMKNKLKR